MLTVLTSECPPAGRAEVDGIQLGSLGWEDAPCNAADRVGSIGCSVQAIALRAACARVRAAVLLSGVAAEGAADADGFKAGGLEAGGSCRFLRSLLLFPDDARLASQARDANAEVLGSISSRALAACHELGTGSAGTRDAHVQYVGGLRSISRLEGERRLVKKQRRFVHALEKMLQLGDADIEALQPMTRPLTTTGELP